VQTIRVRLFLPACVLAALFVHAPVASAHEARRVGVFGFEVGWLDEPVYAGFKNAAVVSIKDSKGNPVNDLGDSLKVDISLGDQKMGPLSLDPAFEGGGGTSGEYHASIIPTAPGNYVFHLAGTVRGLKVDETFTTGKGLEEVKDPAGAQFPVKQPSASELSQKLDRLGGRVELNKTSAFSGSDKAIKLAREYGLGGIAVGALALIVAVVAAAKRKSS
jgi:hypothetical protein